MENINNVKIKYDTPFEVTKQQYNRLMTHCEGVVAGREENGKYYIKVWLMNHVNYVRQVAGMH